MIFKFKVNLKNNEIMYFQTLQDLADELKIHYNTLRNRIQKGKITVENINTTLKKINDDPDTTFQLTVNGVVIQKRKEIVVK